MKLAEIIRYLTNPNLIEQCYQQSNIDPDNGAVFICCKEKLDIDSDVYLFTIDETKSELFFEKNDVKYCELFEVEHAVNLIEYDLKLKNRGYTDMQIAVRLLEYRLNDA